ncbi:hypothetical protein FRC98_12765 [Lujinxingia vulgaris]|uniref:Uncharacterized protein n=1 Tax=Lujinxingia vulgaris TaxID=2600176 RepID=A0A5C6XF01_9DELT|nr:hypothetical protein [Lujinxingia vulgaris]TXD36694.1 hypothetical protein FRC98_12765 [Lujinxingia vulgaris]
MILMGHKRSVGHALAVVVVLVFFLLGGVFFDALFYPAVSFFDSESLNENVERADWKVYPIGCHIIQLPDSHKLIGFVKGDRRYYWAVSAEVIDSKTTSHEFKLDLTGASSKAFSIKYFNERDFYYLYEKIDIGWPHLVDYVDDFFSGHVAYLGLVESSTSSDQGLVFQNYYKEGRNEKLVDAISVQPSMPINNKFGVFFENLLEPSNKNYNLMLEVARTLRLDQRNFARYYFDDGERTPFEDMDSEYGLFEVASISAQDFEALPGGMDQNKFWGHGDRRCDDISVGLLRPKRYLLDYRDVIEQSFEE